MFSAEGEIGRKAIVSRFSQYDTSYFRNYINFVINESKLIDTVHFLDSLHARLHLENKNTSCQPTIQGEQIILMEADATNKCCAKGEVFTRTLPYHLAKWKPEVRAEFASSSTSGNYRFGFNGRSQYVLKESEGKLISPLILFILHSGNFDNGFVNNELQPDFYSSLAAGDTVSIMEFQIVLER